MTQDYDHEEYLEGEEIEIEAIGIDVDAHPIELYKLFKIANLVSGGGEAKHIIEEGYVAVNGELETRKRRKMYDGDFFEFNQEYYVVVCDETNNIFLIGLTDGSLPQRIITTAILRIRTEKIWSI